MGLRGLLVGSLAFALLAASSAQQAPRFKACKRSLAAAKLNDCVKDSLDKAVPELVKGIPAVGLETIDPLRVDSLKVPKGKGAVSLELEFKNLDIYGMRFIRIKRAEIDVDKYKLANVKMDIDGPINLIGDYTVKGKVLVLPITGAGRCNITLVNTKGELELQAKPVTKDGKQFAQVTSLKFVNRDPKRVHYNLENLFNGNKELGENMNLVMNDNWKQIYEDTRIPFQKALQESFRMVADKALQGASYDDIFPK